MHILCFASRNTLFKSNTSLKVLNRRIGLMIPVKGGSEVIECNIIQVIRLLKIVKIDFTAG
jgi:hypothetical protein